MCYPRLVPNANLLYILASVFCFILITGQCYHLVVLIFSKSYPCFNHTSSFIFSLMSTAILCLSPLMYHMFEFNVIFCLSRFHICLSKALCFFEVLRLMVMYLPVALFSPFSFKHQDHILLPESYYHLKSLVTTNCSWVQHTKGIQIYANFGM